ncbi:MAG: YHS domain-containing (seleno)protein [Myxococcota bacterium]
MKARNARLALPLSVTLLVFSTTALGQPAAHHSLTATERQSHFQVSGRHLAIEGYDPVTYFPEGGSEPQKGKDSITIEHRGIVYRFVSNENKETFQADPARYEPAYGGWCAYAMGTSGEKVDINPKAYEIHDGRLFLFYKDLFTNTVKPWQKGRSTLQPKADQNWSAIIQG